MNRVYSTEDNTKVTATLVCMDILAAFDTSDHVTVFSSFDSEFGVGDTFIPVGSAAIRQEHTSATTQ